MSWFEYIESRLAADVDRSLVEKQLALTPTQRLEKLEQLNALARDERAQPAKPR